MLIFSGSSQNPGSSVLDELQLSNGLLWKNTAFSHKQPLHERIIDSRAIDINQFSTITRTAPGNVARKKVYLKQLPKVWFGEHA